MARTLSAQCRTVVARRDPAMNPALTIAALALRVVAESDPAA
jgi:hypothetical protein